LLSLYFSLDVSRLLPEYIHSEPKNRGEKERGNHMRWTLKQETLILSGHVSEFDHCYFTLMSGCDEGMITSELP